MGTVDDQFAADLRRQLELVRAVETGTYEGETTRKLAAVFVEVVTIERSEEIHARAVDSLAGLRHVDVVLGHSAEQLCKFAGSIPTLYYLDAHWSGGYTSGIGDECPILREIEALRAGHPDDCVIIDDARLFAASPPPPHDSEQWPSLQELFDALRDIRPEHFVTVINDQVVGIPKRAKDSLDSYAWRVQDYHTTATTLLQRMTTYVRSLARH